MAFPVPWPLVCMACCLLNSNILEGRGGDIDLKQFRVPKEGFSRDRLCCFARADKGLFAGDRTIGLSAWYLQVSAGSTKISGLQQRTVTVRITAKSLLHLQC